jgi:hypothetical protein
MHSSYPGPILISWQQLQEVSGEISIRMNRAASSPSSSLSEPLSQLQASPLALSWVSICLEGYTILTRSENC